MKTYKLRVGERSYPLAGLTQNVKQAITDHVIAEKQKGNDRRLKKGLVTAVEHAATAERLDGMTFVSTAVGRAMTEDAGQRVLVRAMLEEAAGDEVPEVDVDAVLGEMADLESEGSGVFRRIFFDAYPKLEAAMTEYRSSPPTPTAGGAD